MTTTVQIPNIGTMPRNLDLLNQTLYNFSISLKGMSKTISINWNKFNFSKESLDQIKQSGVKLSNISLFAKLDDYAAQLRHKRLEVEQRTLLVSEQRLVTDSQINLALADYQELLELADELREKLKGEFISGRNEFRSRITALITTPEFQIPVDEQSAKIDEICQKFLEIEELNHLLRVSLKVYRIPSLEEQIQEQTSLKNDLTAYRQAERQAEAETALMTAQQEDLARTRELRSEILTKAQAEIESILAEQIQAITKYEPDVPSTKSQAKLDAHFNRNAKIRSKLQTHIKRMEVLADLNIGNDIPQAIAKLEKLSEEIKPGNQSIKETLTSLQKELNESLTEIKVPETKTIAIEPILF